MGLYDKYILPSFLNCACGSKPINYQRQKVVPLCRGHYSRGWNRLRAEYSILRQSEGEETHWS